MFFGSKKIKKKLNEKNKTKSVLFLSLLSRYVSPSLSLPTASLAAATSCPSSRRAFCRSRAPAIVGALPEAVGAFAFEEEGEEEDDDDGGFELELEELLDEAALARSWTSSTKSRAFPRSSASQMPAEASDSETAAPRDSAAAAAAAAASASGSSVVVFCSEEDGFFWMRGNESARRGNIILLPRPLGNAEREEEAANRERDSRGLVGVEVF